MSTWKLVYGFVYFYTFFKNSAKADNFPSLLMTNATLAVVIDREYVSDNYDTIKNFIEKYMIYSKREILKHGGVNVKYYSWTRINIRRDFTALLSVASCKDTWELFSAVDEEYLLHMAITEQDCPRLPPDQAITVPIIEKSQEIPQLLLDLKMWRAFRWPSIVLIHDDTLDRDMVTRVINIFSKNTPDDKFLSSAITVVKLTGNASNINIHKIIEEQLSKLPINQIGSNFLVVTDLDVVNTILTVAKSLGMVNPKSQWLYVISGMNYKHNNISVYAPLLGEGENVAFVYNSTKAGKNCVSGIECYAEEILRGFMLALDKAVEEEEDISSQIPEEEWEAIRPTKLERRNSMLNSVKLHIKDYGTCNNCTTWQLKSGDTWGKMFQQYNDSDVIELLNVGHWRPTDGPALLDELFPHVTHGFRGRTLPLISFHNPPWQILKFNGSDKIVEYSGVVFNIIKEISHSLNFTFEIKTVNKNKIGLSSNETYNPSSENNSMIEDVKVINSLSEKAIEIVRKKKVMMAACAIIVTNPRKNLINFTQPISIQPYTFLVSRPKELSRALLFMSPFAYDTWLCLAFAVAAMGPILYYIHKFSPVYEYKGIPTKGGFYTIHNCLWYMYGALLQQGGMYLPYADSGRLVIGTWWLVVLVVVTTYCGNLVAFLTFPKIDIPIKTVDDLLIHSETISWTIIKDSFLEDHLKTTDQPKYQALYKKAIFQEHVTTEMLNKIQQGKHVFVDWKTNLQFILKQEFLKTNRCDLTLSSEDFLDEQLALIVAKDNPYLPMINERIKRLHQIGLIQKWITEFLPKKDRCWNAHSTSEVKNHTVNLDDMQGSFFVLFLGFIVAILIIIIEKLWYKRKISREKKVIQPFMS